MGPWSIANSSVSFVLKVSRTLLITWNITFQGCCCLLRFYLHMKEWKGQMVEVLSCGFLVGQCIPEIDGLVIVTKFDMHFANYVRVVFF